MFLLQVVFLVQSYLLLQSFFYYNYFDPSEPPSYAA